MVITLLPSRDLVRRLLTYDPATGVLTHLPRPRERFSTTRAFSMWNARFAGKPAGSRIYSGTNVVIDYAKYRAHRIIWLYVYGDPVPDIIDHADGDPHNNRIENLRAATHAQNLANCIARKHNKLGVKGVAKRGNRFWATIFLNRKAVRLGSFDTTEEAAKAYRDAAIKAYGEFARW